MPRPSNTVERRAQICQGLLRVMARQGYAKATIADIAREAGLTAGLVHYHFGSKQDVLLTLIDQLMTAHGCKIDRKLATVGPALRDRVGAFVDCHLRLGEDEDPAVLACWLGIIGEALCNREVKARLEPAMTALVERLAAILRAGAKGPRQRREAAAAAAAIMAAIQGYFVLAETSRGVIPRGSAATAVRRMADGLLTGS